MKSSLIIASIALFTMAHVAGFAQSAGSFPTQPIRLVVPYSPGGSADVLARVLGKQIAETLGQNVIVENKPGAGTAIGARHVAQSAADGHTLLMGTVSSQAMTPLINPNAGYDPAKDFVSVAPVAAVPFAMLVKTSIPANSLSEFLTLARAQPDKLTYASAGVGTSNHLAAELLSSMAGIKLVHVPYKGSAPALTDLLGGQVDLMFDLLVTAAQHIDSGKVRALAVTSAKEVPMLKGVPTVKESGLPDYEVSAWFGIFAPAGTPDGVVARINAAVRRATSAEDTKRQLQAMGAQPLEGDSVAFAAFVRDEYARWEGVIRKANIVAN